MKYHMLRAEREINDPVIFEKIIKNNKYATIGLCKNNEPYLVTLSYGYDTKNKELVFHCSKTGQKIDFIKNNPEVCLTILEDNGYKQNECSHSYRSLIIRGKMEIIEDDSMKKNGIETLIEHLENNPENMKSKLLMKRLEYERMQILKLKIIEITGKEGK
jgi:uncharacterized protein